MAEERMFQESEKLRLGPGHSAQDLKTIRAIATRIVAGQVERGQLDLNDREALKKAVVEAGRTAVSAYHAALERMG